MASVREAWTDERLDDLTKGVDRGFDRVDARFEQIDRRFERVDREFHVLRAEMNTRFDSVEGRIDGLQRTMVVGFGSIVASVLGSVAAVAAAHVL